MSPRRGVSLVEVLVAATLLAIGIGGTLHALFTSARLRLDADRREAMVGLLLDRLGWFEAAACAGGDTAGVVRLADGPEAQWAVQAVGSVRVLTMQGRRAPGAAHPTTRILTSRPCA